MNREEAETRKKIKQVISEIITEDMNDAEKVLVVHDWICLNVKYDYEAFRNSAIRPESYTAGGAMLNGLAVCAGYSLAFCDYMNVLDIPCKYISSDSMNHAWNHVLLDNEWYWLDTTHDDITFEDGAYPDFIRYDYFLLNGKRVEDECEFGKDSVETCNGSKWKEAVFEKYIITDEEDLDLVIASQGNSKLKHIVAPHNINVVELITEKYPEYYYERTTAGEGIQYGDSRYQTIVLWEE